jgi:hypothetical protein
VHVGSAVAAVATLLADAALLERDVLAAAKLADPSHTTTRGLVSCGKCTTSPADRHEQYARLAPTRSGRGA